MWASQPCRFRRLFVKRRSGDLADADLLAGEVRLVALDGVEGGFDGGVLHEPGGVLGEGGDGEDNDECSH